MSNSDPDSRVIFLRPKPHPYDFHNIGRALSEYMREPDFLRILVTIFESAPHLYQDFIPAEDMFKDEAPPQTRNHEQPSQYITDDIDAVQWRIDVCTVPNATYYRGDSADVKIVSCVVADLSGGSVRITLMCHKPEAKQLVEAIQTVIQETWLSGIQSTIQPELDTAAFSLSALPTETKTKLKEEPWMQIPKEAGWHREAVRLWWQGYSYSDIEKALVGVTAKTAQNIFSDYRKDERYGNEIVPLAIELRKMGIRWHGK